MSLPPDEPWTAYQVSSFLLLAWLTILATFNTFRNLLRGDEL